jgi:hypothetical protein
MLRDYALAIAFTHGLVETGADALDRSAFRITGTLLSLKT